MLQVAKVKYTKVFTRPYSGVATRATTLAFGEYGIKAVSGGYVTANQIEAVRMLISKYMKRKGKLWIRIYPDLPITEKPSSRMGGGKSPIDHWCAVVQKGRMLFEIAGVTDDIVQGAFHLLKNKLPVKVKLVKKE